MALRPKLFVKQRITLFVNRYELYEATIDGKEGKLVAFAEQERFSFKEKIHFYNDTSKQQEIFVLRAEKVLDVHGRYFVEDPRGSILGVFQKVFKKSLIRSTWQALDKTGNPHLTISESSLAMAIVRRLYGFLPIPFIDIILDAFFAFFIRYHFSFQDKEGQEKGEYYKITRFRDHYILSLDDETFAQHAWQVYAALAVGLDALQSR
jgi:hypothetical protein